MLAVQEYLRSGKSLENLHIEYGIGCNPCESMGVVSLNYSQISSDLSLPICQECRGLILELGTWDVVCQTFLKFFNASEPNAAPVKYLFDWATAKVYDKLDGALISMFFYKGKWNASTRKMPDASGAVGDYDMTFAKLIDATMKEMGFSFLELNPDLFYAFELTTPLKNFSVVPYSEYMLTLLAARNKHTLQEVDISTLPEITAPKVRLLPLSDLDEIMVMIEKLPVSEGEGVVVVDGNFRRLKIKSPDYLASFRAVCNAEASPRNRIAILMSDTCDDIYGLLPQALKDDLDELKLKFEALTSKVASDYAKIAGLETQKEFALEALKFPYSAWLFELRQGKSLEDIMKATMPEKIERLL